MISPQSLAQRKGIHANAPARCETIDHHLRAALGTKQLQMKQAFYTGGFVPGAKA